MLESLGTFGMILYNCPLRRMFYENHNNSAWTNIWTTFITFYVVWLLIVNDSTELDDFVQVCTDKVQHFLRISFIQVATSPFAIIKNYFYKENISWERSEGEAAQYQCTSQPQPSDSKINLKKIFPGQRARVKKTKL